MPGIANDGILQGEGPESGFLGSTEDLVAFARQALEHESECVHSLVQRVDPTFARVVIEITQRWKSGRHLTLAGVGKSGWIAGKIATTLCSIGLPAHLLNGAEAAHGDLGMVDSDSVVILFSKSGSTAELLKLIGPLQKRNVLLVGILGKVDSPLGRVMDFVLDASVPRESCPSAFVPTASSTVALTWGHALVTAIMRLCPLDPGKYEDLHPAGQIGRNVSRTVGEVMHRLDKVAKVRPEDSLRSAVIAMTRFPLGAACVVTDQHSLLGIITDGDIRRSLERDFDFKQSMASEIMTREPVLIHPQASLGDALRRMEDRAHPLSVLPVVEEEGSLQLVGLLRLHDIYQPDN